MTDLTDVTTALDAAYARGGYQERIEVDRRGGTQTGWGA